MGEGNRDGNHGRRKSVKFDEEAVKVFNFVPSVPDESCARITSQSAGTSEGDTMSERWGRLDRALSAMITNGKQPRRNSFPPPLPRLSAYKRRFPRRSMLRSDLCSSSCSSATSDILDIAIALGTSSLEEATKTNCSSRTAT